MKEIRPKIKIQFDNIDRIIEILTLLLLLFIWGFMLFEFPKLPEIIPIHFNYAGEADDFGSKYNMLFLPIISTILYIAITIINRFPHTFNYLVKITEENAERQYKIACKMMRLLKISVVIVFSFLNISIIISAKNQSDSLGLWFLPIVISIIFLPLIYGIRNSIKVK